MSLTLTPHYELPAPVIIGARLTPAVAIADGFISVEATGIEDSGRAHFRFIIEAPMIDTYTSGDSDVTVVGRTWTHAALMALEAITNEFAGDDLAEWIPADIVTWLRAGASTDCLTATEEIGEAIEAMD